MRRKRLLEKWNKCASVELVDMSPEARSFARHYFYSGAMACYGCLKSADLDGASDEQYFQAFEDLRMEVTEHIEALRQAAKARNLPVIPL
jgi:hypothetical protein